VLEVIVLDKILIVDDDKSLCHFLNRALSRANYTVEECYDAETALSRIKTESYGLVLLDNRMPPGPSGLEIFRKMREADLKLPVIIMTAFGTTETAIEAMKLGAYDYVTKPFDLKDILDLTKKAIESGKLMREVVSYPKSSVTKGNKKIVGSSKKMQEVYKMIGQVAESNATVLIRGESGVGKGLVAQAIYNHSLRKDKPFLSINCAAIPETLLESELFGYEKGSFTGADKRRIGKFEQASDGTIFLDEIGDMPLVSQAKILRVLQEGEIERIGSNQTQKVDVRIIAATNKILEQLVRERKFREDLYYRLKIITVDIPPLRERAEDIPELIEYFLEQRATNNNLITEQAMKKLIEYPWPGNVRELDNTIQRALILSSGKIITDLHIIFDTNCVMPQNIEELESQLERQLEVLFKYVLNQSGQNVRSSIFDRIEQFLIKRALKETNGNQVQTAKLLGISRNTLRHRMRKYDIN
jgi:two-component system, NtrC family, response regulator AtoC